MFYLNPSPPNISELTVRPFRAMSVKLAPKYNNMKITLRNFLVRILNWLWINLSHPFRGKIFEWVLNVWNSYFPLPAPHVYKDTPRKAGRFPIIEFFFNPQGLFAGPILFGCLFKALIKHPDFLAIPG